MLPSFRFLRPLSTFERTVHICRPSGGLQPLIVFQNLHLFVIFLRFRFVNDRATICHHKTRKICIAVTQPTRGLPCFCNFKFHFRHIGTANEACFLLPGEHLKPFRLSLLLRSHRLKSRAFCQSVACRKQRIPAIPIRSVPASTTAPVLMWSVISVPPFWLLPPFSSSLPQRSSPLPCRQQMKKPENAFILP